MFLSPWRKSPKAKTVRKTAARAPVSGVRLGIELLEDRTLPSATLVAQVNQKLLGSFPAPVLASGGKVFFQADNGVDGSQLWATTGSGAAELTMLQNGGTYGHTAVNGRDVFVGYSFDAANNYHEVLYGSDGSTQGTAQLLDLAGGTLVGSPVTVGNNAYVAVQWTNAGHSHVALYRTDGTAAGTAQVWDLGADSSASGNLVAFNGKLYLAGQTTTGGTVSYGLYASDGSGSTPALVQSAAASLQGLQVLGGRLYFYNQALDSAAGLWDFNVYASDTSGAQAGLVKTVTASSSFSNYKLSLLAGAGGEVFFAFQSNYSTSPTFGQTIDLYRTDGTALNTSLIQSFGAAGYGGATGTGTSASYADLGLMTSSGAAVYFTVQTHDYFGGHVAAALYRADALSAGAVKLLDLAPRSSYPSYAGTAAGGAVLFTVDDGSHGGELWRTDGTAQGTSLVLDINPGAAGSNPSGFTVLNGVYYFTADDGSHGDELWRTDGTAAGTALVLDINPGAAASFPSSLTVFAGQLYFAASDPTAGNELWASDGTAGGTRRVADINPGVADSGPANFLAAPNALYFSADDGTHGNELWCWASASPTTTALTASNTASVYGQSVTFTATVGATVVGAGTPTGTVQFQVDGANFGTLVVLVNGQATSAAVALSAGNHAVTTVYSADSALFLNSTGALSGGLTVAVATPQVVFSGTGYNSGTNSYSDTYNASAQAASAAVTGVNNSALGTATMAYYQGSYSSLAALQAAIQAGTTVQLSGAPTNAGNYTALAFFVGSSNYAAASDSAPFVIAKASLTVTPANASRSYGAGNPVFAGTVVGVQSADGITATYSTSATAASGVGGYAITATLADPNGKLANYSVTLMAGTLTVNPAVLTATGVAVRATAGAPFAGVVARFTNADPFGGVGSYTATITWGDGSTSAGTLQDLGNGTFAVHGAHTYADPGTDAIRVSISHKLGYTTTAAASGTGTVVSLGTGLQANQTSNISFWQGRQQGQALIKSFNGGQNATALSAWLATSFANLYGAGAGSHNLTGMTNAQVARFFLGLSASLDQELLAAALNVYATTQSLGGAAARAYGFNVTAAGLGASSISVHSDGAAFGVSNNTTLNTYQLLRAVNSRVVGGVLYNGNKNLQNLANNLFGRLNRGRG